MPVPDLTLAYGLTLAQPLEQVPPQAFSWWLWPLALLILLAVAAWYLLALPRLARREPARPDEPVDAVREQYLSQAEAALARYESEALDLRGLHLEYSRILREYGSARTRRDLTSLTSGDLARVPGAEPLRSALDSFAEPAFAYRSDAEARRAHETTRAVISTW